MTTSRERLLEARTPETARGPRLTAALRPRMSRIGMPPIPAEELARITVPTTPIWGRHDVQTPVRTAEAAVDRHGWPLHVLDDAADDLAHEQPTAFLAALRAALDEHARPIDQRSTS